MRFDVITIFPDYFAPLQLSLIGRAIADGLRNAVGLRQEDVFINLVEVKKENWSFGNGEAQYAN